MNRSSSEWLNPFQPLRLPERKPGGTEAGHPGPSLPYACSFGLVCARTNGQLSGPSTTASFCCADHHRFPASPAAFADAGWPDIAPYYEGLATAPLSRDNVEDWLKSWSQLEELIDEAGTMAMIAYTGDTADAEKEKAHLRFSTEIFPQAHEQGVRLSKRLLELDYTRPGLETTVQRFRTDAEIFREENVALFAELEELSAQYQKIVGGLTAQWEGETKTIPQLQPYLKERDRQVRERAWRVGNEAYLAHRDNLAALFDKMFVARTKVAGNAGFPNYQEYAFKSKHRFDYTPADCARFHDAMEKTVVPAVARQLEYRRERLGLDRVRPWDLGVELERVESLKPFDDVAVFVDRAKSIFRRVDPKLGRRVRIDGRGWAARPREPEGQGTGRVLHEAELPRQAVHLHERGRRRRRREHAGARGRAFVPRLRGAQAAAHLAALSGARSGGARVDEHGAARVAVPAEAGRLLHARRGAIGADRASRGHSLQPPAHRERRRVPELDLHEWRGARRGGARSAWLEIRSSIRAWHRLVGARAGARRALVSTAAHFRVSVLLHRVRDRTDGGIAGVASQPDRSGDRP